MQSRIRFAAAALAAMTVIGALTSSAGASTSSWNAKANAGALDVTLLGNKLELAGGITEADANSANTAEAMGTGLCISNGTPGPCPTTVSSPTSGLPLSTTQTATQNGDGAATPPAACATPTLPLVLATIGVGCGNASASETSGNPTAEGDGSILGAAVNVTMGNALNAMGIALPSAANAPCNGVSTPAASSSPGTGSSSLPAPAASLLGAVNSVTGGLKLPTLNPTTVDQSSAQNSTCSILGGLVNEVSGVPVLGGLVSALFNGTSLNAAMGTSLFSVSAVESKSTIATSTVNGDPVETAHAIGDGLDVNVMGGMFDIKVIPAVATATVDRTTGQTTENCTPGLIQVTVNNGTPNLVDLQPLGTALNQILQQLDASPLAPLLDALLQVPSPGILNCNAPVGSGTSTSVTGGEVNVNLLPAIAAAAGGPLLGLKVNDVTASASSASATPASTGPTTSPTHNTPQATPAATPAAPAAPAAVPNVTSVHTGEFWAGTLPIILMIGMALAGSLLIGRRRVLAFARSLPLISRRWGSH
jgi:hypothetical protein